jgi:hypothetical protein
MSNGSQLHLEAEVIVMLRGGEWSWIVLICSISRLCLQICAISYVVIQKNHIKGVS